MSYIVLARKWRPQRFAEVIGQDHITRTLANVIHQKRIAHAYLFVGPRGVGKTSLARILAKALNCEKGPLIDPCQKCTSCKDVTEGKSLDVLEIDGASNRGIEEIRQLRENIRFSPVHGKFRIYIIDEIHMLTTEAFNALLKTLEEPPAHVKFIFATTAPQRLPLTILSRCQRFNFRLISVKEIIGQLKKIVKKENISVSDEALYQIAREAQGSMRDAESILDQLIAFGGKKIEEKDVFLLMGHVSKDIFSKFMETVITKNLPSAISHFNRIMDKGESPQQLLTDILEYLRNLLFIKLGKEGESQLDIITEDLSVLKAQASKIDEQQIMSLIDILSPAGQDMRWSSSPRLLMEVMLIKTIHSIGGPAPTAVPLQEASPALQSSPPPSGSNGLNLEEIRTQWPQVIEKVKKEKITVGACLIEGEPIKFHHPVLTISFENGFSFHRETVEKIENKKVVEKVLCDLFKQEMMIHCLIGETVMSNNPGKNFPKASAPPPSPHRNEIDNVVRLFNGKIIEGDS
jgi:DNA polymerase-3 subunit gamma/tau